MTETRFAAPFLAVLVAWLIHWIGGFPLFAGATIALVIYAYAARPARNNLALADIIAGQWLALWALSGGLWFAGVPAHIFPWPGWIGAIVIYQLFLWLWSAHSSLFRHVCSGAAAGGVVLISAAVSHGWLT